MRRSALGLALALVSCADAASPIDAGVIPPDTGIDETIAPAMYRYLWLAQDARCKQTFRCFFSSTARLRAYHGSEDRCRFEPPLVIGGELATISEMLDRGKTQLDEAFAVDCFD